MQNTSALQPALYLEATLSVEVAHLRCGPFASKCRIPQPLWQPPTPEGREAMPGAAARRLTAAAEAGGQVSQLHWDCHTAGTPLTCAANPDPPECNQ